MAVAGNADTSQSMNLQSATLHQILENQTKHNSHTGTNDGSDVSGGKKEKFAIRSRSGLKRTYNDTSGALLEGTQFSALRMRFLPRRKCNPWCRCCCHSHTRLKSPDLLRAVIGQLFLGYAGFTLLTGPCDLPGYCQGSGQSFLQVNYFFPG